MARNRKRAKERRANRPQRSPGSRPGAGGLRSNGREDVSGLEPEHTELEPTELDPTEPDPTESDPTESDPTEPELGADREQDGDHDDLGLPEDELPGALGHATPDAEIADAQIALGAAEASRPGPEDEPRSPRARRAEGPEEHDDAGELEAVRHDRAPAAGRAGTVTRLVHFVQGSWRELQRVQWPDRRQVMQATGVVLGFVVVAGLFLGVADWAAGKLVNFILK